MIFFFQYLWGFHSYRLKSNIQCETHPSHSTCQVNMALQIISSIANLLDKCWGVHDLLQMVGNFSSEES